LLSKLSPAQLEAAVRNQRMGQNKETWASPASASPKRADLVEGTERWQVPMRNRSSGQVSVHRAGGQAGMTNLLAQLPIPCAGALPQLYSLNQAVCFSFCQYTDTYITGVAYLKLPQVCLCSFPVAAVMVIQLWKRKRGKKMDEKRRKKEEGREERRQGRGI